MARKYQKVSELLPVIKELSAQGKNQEQIAKQFGLSSAKVVWNLLYREKQKEIQGVPKFRGRKPAKTLQKYCLLYPKCSAASCKVSLLP